MISEKNILKTDLEQILQGNTCYTIALYVRDRGGPTTPIAPSTCFVYL